MIFALKKVIIEKIYLSIETTYDFSIGSPQTNGAEGCPIAEGDFYNAKEDSFMNKKGSVVGLVALILGVAVTILVAVFSAKNDVDEMQQMQETINTNEEYVQEIGDSIQDINADIQSGYDNLDDATGY